MKKKNVIQLDENMYFVGYTLADESPLEPGLYHLPAGCIDVNEKPEPKENHRARWNGKWIYEEVVVEEETRPELTYREKRMMEYPPITDYLDAIVKGDTDQLDSYIKACLAVKEKYPKE